MTRRQRIVGALWLRLLRCGALASVAVILSQPSPVAGSWCVMDGVLRVVPPTTAHCVQSRSNEFDIGGGNALSSFGQSPIARSSYAGSWSSRKWQVLANEVLARPTRRKNVLK
jgi:hypothetical protein